MWHMATTSCKRDWEKGRLSGPIAPLNRIKVLLMSEWLNKY